MTAIFIHCQSRGSLESIQNTDGAVLYSVYNCYNTMYIGNLCMYLVVFVSLCILCFLCIDMTFPMFWQVDAVDLLSCLLVILVEQFKIVENPGFDCRIIYRSRYLYTVNGIPCHKIG
jgi:uncharacterized membrane protein